MTYTSHSQLKIEIYADGAVLEDMLAALKQGVVKGFTTNPTLMKKAGVTNYEAFAHKVLEHITTLPISFEVFSDDFAEMEQQAMKIKSWGSNVYVKIPVMNTKKQSACPLIKKLAAAGVKLNVTAILTTQQVKEVAAVLNPNVPSIVSVFAGRVADTGVNPLPLMKESLSILKPNTQAKLLWASSRELFNVIEANDMGCHIITVTPEILKKLSMLGKDLTDLSWDTVKMFYEDATKAGFSLDVTTVKR